LSHVADNPERHINLVIGDGQCVALARHAAQVGHTSTWRRGVPVRGSGASKGTIIATFGGDPPRYENRTDGASHCAILVGEEDVGLAVIDQWKGRPCQRRVIRYKDGAGLPCDDGDAYFIVETEA
jgi:hypothetical protein